MQDLPPNTDMPRPADRAWYCEMCCCAGTEHAYGVLNAIVQDGSLFGFAWGY